MALPKPPTAQQIQKAALTKSPSSPYYYGGGGFKPPTIQPAAAAKPSANSPYYYGGGPFQGPTTGAAPAAGATGGTTVVKPPWETWTQPTVQEPDWNALINANYLTQGAESQAGPMRAQADIGLRSGIGNALYQYGWNPETMNMQGWGNAAPYVDPGAITAAQNNPNSALAQIQRAQTLAQNQDASRLAARGMLSSGAFTVANEASAQGAGESRSNAYSSLMNAVNQGVGQRAGVESQIAQMLQDARAKAAAFVAQNYQQPASSYMPQDWIQQLNDYYGAGATAPPAAPAVGNLPPVRPVTTPKAPVVQKAAAAKPSANSPYYYGGGGYKPAAPKRK